MPQIKKLNKINREIKEELAERIQSSGYGDYREHAEWINKKFEEQGIDCTVSHVPVWQFGQQLEQEIKRKEEIADLARALGRESGDDANEIGKALIELASAKLLEVLLSFDPCDLQDVSFPDLVRCIEMLNRSKLAVQSYQMKIQKKTIRVLDNLEPDLKGLSPERAAAIRAQILGIPD